MLILKRVILLLLIAGTHKAEAFFETLWATITGGEQCNKHWINFDFNGKFDSVNVPYFPIPASYFHTKTFVPEPISLVNKQDHLSNGLSNFLHVFYLGLKDLIEANPRDLLKAARVDNTETSRRKQVSDLPK